MINLEQQQELKGIDKDYLLFTNELNNNNNLLINQLKYGKLGTQIKSEILIPKKIKKQKLYKFKKIISKFFNLF